MTPALAQRRRDLEERLRVQRARLRGIKRPVPRKKDWRKWALLVVLILVLLLWLLFHGCSDEPAPVEVGVAAPSQPANIGMAVEPPTPPTGRVPRHERPAYETEPPDALPWITALRLQVAARSPRLAKCFVGVDRPGRLKWTASVEPLRGAVSDQTLEPTLSTADLTSEQKTCVLGVLSVPPYHLEADGRSTPSRVGLVIEF